MHGFDALEHEDSSSPGGLGMRKRLRRAANAHPRRGMRHSIILKRHPQAEQACANPCTGIVATTGADIYAGAALANIQPAGH